MAFAASVEDDAPAAGAEGLFGERARQTCSRVWEEWNRAGGGRTQGCVPRTEVCSQDIRELSLPGCSFSMGIAACSASEVGKGARLCTCWERTSEFVNEFKGVFSYTSIQHTTPSLDLQCSVVGRGGVSCPVLPFLDSQVNCTRVS